MPTKPRGPGERHIRAYLRYLQDPSTTVDADAVRRAVAAVEAASGPDGDPIIRARALSALERAQVPTTEGLEDAFVSHAAAWADAAQVTYNALTTLGVPPDVLARAGMEPSAAQPPPRPKRLPVVPIGDVYVKLPARGTFTAKEVGAAWGRTAHVANHWLKALAADGRVERLGPDPDWADRGRAPIIWRKVAKR